MSLSFIEFRMHAYAKIRWTALNVCANRTACLFQAILNWVLFTPTGAGEKTQAKNEKACLRQWCMETIGNPQKSTSTQNCAKIVVYHTPFLTGYAECFWCRINFVDLQNVLKDWCEVDSLTQDEIAARGATVATGTSNISKTNLKFKLVYWSLSMIQVQTV